MRALAGGMARQSLNQGVTAMATEFDLQDKASADAVYMALENYWTNARDDSEYERQGAIDMAIQLINDIPSFPYRVTFDSDDSMAIELEQAFVSVEEEPEDYGLAEFHGSVIRR